MALADPTFTPMHRGAQPVAVVEACVPNIAGRGRSRRMRGGLFYLAVGVAFGAILIVQRASWWAYPLLAVIFARAALGWFQAKEKT